MDGQVMPIALVYRAGCVECGRSCCPHSKGRGRQYAFDTIAAFAAWAGRKPYSGEMVVVIPIVAGKCLPRSGGLPAAEAVAWLKGVLA